MAELVQRWLALTDGDPIAALVVSAIVPWNTVYLARVVDSLKRKGKNVPDNLLKHVSPLTWEHINLTGVYSWQTEPSDPGAFRPLREERTF